MIKFYGFLSGYRMDSALSLFRIAAAQFLSAPNDPAAKSALDEGLEALALQANADEEVDAVLGRAAHHPTVNSLRLALDEMSDRWVSRSGCDRYEGVLLAIPLILKARKQLCDLPASAVMSLTKGFHKHQVVDSEATVVLQPWMSMSGDLHVNHARRKRLLVGMMADALRGPGDIPYQHSLPPIERLSSSPLSVLRFLTLSVQGYCDCIGLASHWQTPSGAARMRQWMLDLVSTLNRQGWELQAAGSPCFYSEAIGQGDLISAQQNLRLFCQISKLTHARFPPEACTLRITRVWPQPTEQIALRIEYLHGGEQLNAQGLTLRRAVNHGSGTDPEQRLRHYAELAAGKAGIGHFEAMGFECSSSRSPQPTE